MAVYAHGASQRLVGSPPMPRKKARAPPPPPAKLDSQCAALAPTASVAQTCCALPARARIYGGLLAVLHRIRTAPLVDIFGPGAVSAAVRQVGIQPFAPPKDTRWSHEESVRAGLATFGNETAHFVNLSLGFSRRADVRRDFFGLPAMGLWQVPAQFDCLLGRLRRIFHGRAAQRIARRTVTIGTWSGWTDLFVAAHLRRLSPSLAHTTYDVRGFASECIISLFKHYNVTRVRHGWYGGNESWEPLGLGSRYDGQYPAQWREPVIDFCFIDGGHSYYHAFRDFRTMRSACRVIAFHDIVNANVGWRQQPLLWKHLTNVSHENFASEFGNSNCTQQPVVGQHVMGLGILSRLPEEDGER